MYARSAKKEKKKRLQVEIQVFLECGSVILLVDLPYVCAWKKLGFNPILKVMGN